MPGLRKGYFYRGCLLNLNMSYEEMILKIAENGLAVSVPRPGGYETETSEPVIAARKMNAEMFVDGF